MTGLTDPSGTALPADQAVLALYQRLLQRWNARDAAGFAALFTPDGQVIGFDGSSMDGPAETEEHLRQIFADHQTATYVSAVKSVSRLAPGVALLRGIAGLVPPGQVELNPAANALQTVVAVAQDGQWRVALFQNTPAAFHGRPELREALTEELQAVLRGQQTSHPAGH